MLEQEQGGPEVQISSLRLHLETGVQGVHGVLESAQRIQDLSLQETDVAVTICDGDLLDLRQAGLRADRMERSHRELETVVNGRICGHKPS